jgi:hypothetical protein
MAKDHFIPATFLTRFSDDQKTKPMRSRKTWILRTGGKQASYERVGNIGVIGDLDTIYGEGKKGLIDVTWEGYEGLLNEALRELLDPAVPSVDAHLWLRALVPFVAGLFVRGPDFSRRYESGETMSQVVLEEGQEWAHNNSNVSRLIAMRRILAPIMAARWTVSYKTGPGAIISNDLGYADNRYGSDPTSTRWLIPLGTDAVLELDPCPDGHGRKVLFDAGGGNWRAFIERRSLRWGSHHGLNVLTAQAARKFVVGPKRDSVEQYREALEFPPYETMIPQVVTSPRMQVVHELDWDRLATAIAYDSTDPRLPGFEIDWATVSASWHVLPLLPANLPEFTTGLQLRGRSIWLYMTEVPGFTDYLAGPFPWDGPGR